jgi:hypothetical protein
VQFDAMTVSLSSSYDNVAASWSRHLDWVGCNEYFDIHVLIHYLSSLPHTLRPTGTSFYASLSCRMDTPLIRTAYSLRVLIHLGGLVSCTDMLRSCANPQRQNHTSSTHFGLQSTLFCWSIELTAVLIVYLPGRMGWADCLQHMARVPVVHLNRACIVPFLLGFVLLLVLLHRRVLQTAVGCGHTLVLMDPRGASLPIDKQVPRGALFRSDLAWSGKRCDTYSYVISTGARNSSRCTRRLWYGST